MQLINIKVYELPTCYAIFKYPTLLQIKLKKNRRMKEYVKMDRKQKMVQYIGEKYVTSAFSETSTAIFIRMSTW
jgi:hypothetical protein